MKVDPSKWLGGTPVSSGRWSPAIPARPAFGHDLTFFINVMDYYAAVAAEIRKTRPNQGDFVYMTGWVLDPDTVVDPPGTATRQTLVEVFGEAAKRTVQIRLLLDHLPNGTRNQEVVTRLRALPNVDGVIDHVHQLAGAQHEKNVIIRNGGGVFAFCGSADFENQRLGRLAKRGPTETGDQFARSPFHEVNIRLQGPAVRDIWNGFCLRYAAASRLSTQVLGGAPGLVNNPGFRALFPSFFPPSASLEGRDGMAGLFWPTGSYQSGGVAARVVRTLPNGRRQRTTNFNFGRDTAYPFAPVGEHSYYDIVMAAIDKTERFLYLEDQYFFFSAPTVLGKNISQRLSELLARSSFEKLIAVIAGTGTIQSETYQAGSRRRDFMRVLGPERSRKVEVYGYTGNVGSPYWIHAKMWTFDDELAVVGSANLNRRGYTSDTELAIAFCDTETADEQNVVKRLRVDLWEKHLNMPLLDASGMPVGTTKLVPDRKVLFDFLAAAPLWGRAPLLIKLDLEADSPPDIDMVRQNTPEIKNRYLQAAAAHLGLAFLTGRDKQWDIVIDPDGG